MAEIGSLEAESSKPSIGSSTILPTLKPSTHHSTPSESSTLNSPSHSHIQVGSWNENDVRDWLTRHQIDQEIQKIIRNFNGAMLMQLNSVKKTAPDYFYTAISKNNQIELFAVLKFSIEFEKLFHY